MFQFGATGESIVNQVRDFFYLVFNEFAGLWFWPAVCIGLMLLAIIIMFILINHSYERRILKSVDKLNAYFLSKPFITEENLVEFNLKMKKVPKVLRNAWQIYMLNREDGPSAYINANTCIDKPLRTSSIEKNLSNFTIFTVLLTFISFVTGIQYTTFSTAVSGLGSILFYSTLVPLGIVFLYTVSVLIMKVRKNDIYTCLYDNFPLYERNLTKAVSTLPSYVDYEILFTKKEIKEGIPILQQYLEKRALVEQQELEKAREASMACEEYNFDELGIDGSLVLERAMKECETFIKTRRRLQEECDQIETEKENYKKNYEITEKDFQRKLQASRENLESLKAQQEASTNRIESNYIKKQQGDEIKKQQQLEKDQEESTAKFNEEQATLEQEVEKRKQEIEEKKNFVEQAMLLEFKHYANTLYKALAQKATELGNQKLMSLAQENTDLKALMTDLQGMDVETPTVQENLVQPEDVADGKLYDMTSSDEKDLEKGRIESNKNEKEETKKEEERKKAEKLAKEQEEKLAENPDAKITEKPDDTDSTNTNGGDEIAGADGNDGNYTSTDDEGKKMDEEVEEEKKEEDLDAIQKKIDEESANLEKQKQEFQNDLNDTISKIDSSDTEQPKEEVVETQPEEEKAEIPVVEDPVEKEPAKEKEPEIEEEKPEANNEPKEEAKEEEVEEPKEEAKEEEPKEDVAEEPKQPRQPKARATSRRGATRTRARGRSSSKDKASSAMSDIDALNAEMEKLLDSTKK